LYIHFRLCARPPLGNSHCLDTWKSTVDTGLRFNPAYVANQQPQTTNSGILSMNEGTERTVKTDSRKKSLQTRSSSEVALHDSHSSPTRNSESHGEQNIDGKADRSKSVQTTHSDGSRVTFSEEISVKTVPDCWDYLMGQGEETVTSVKDSSSPLPSAKDNRQDMTTTTTSETIDTTEELTEAPFRGPSSPFLSDPTRIYSTIVKPIPQRPIHPQRMKVQCVTNALQTNEEGPRMPSSLSSSIRRQEDLVVSSFDIQQQQQGHMDHESHQEYD